MGLNWTCLGTVAFAGLTAGQALANDVQTLENNVVAQLTANALANSTIASDLSALTAGGTFSDVDYANTTNASWLAFVHVNRLHDMTVAWATSSSGYYQNAALKTSILNAYNYWVSKDLQHPNWWFNDIGVPGSLSETMLILQKFNALPAGNFQAAATIVDSALAPQKTLSAANLVWTAYATRNEGLLRYLDPAASSSMKTSATTLVQNSFNAIGSTIKLTNSDGVNNDYSFHPHGPMVYNGGSGQAWLTDSARIAAQATGTSYGLSTANHHLLIDYLLNGDQFMTRGVTYDIVTNGRDWSRTGQSDPRLLVCLRWYADPLRGIPVDVPPMGGAKWKPKPWKFEAGKAARSTGGWEMALNFYKYIEPSANLSDFEDAVITRYRPSGQDNALFIESDSFTHGDRNKPGLKYTMGQ